MRQDSNQERSVKKKLKSPERTLLFFPAGKVKLIARDPYVGIANLQLLYFLLHLCHTIFRDITYSRVTGLHLPTPQ